MHSIYTTKITNRYKSYSIYKQNPVTHQNKITFLMQLCHGNLNSNGNFASTVPTNTWIILIEVNQQNLFAFSLLYHINASKTAGEIGRVFEDCVYGDTEVTDHTYYGEPDHEILINTVIIYLIFSDAAYVRLNQKGNTVSILGELKKKKTRHGRGHITD